MENKDIQQVEKLIERSENRSTVSGEARRDNSEVKSDMKYITLPIFATVMTIMIAFMGWFLVVNNALSARVDNMSDDYTLIQTQLSQIQTDLVWIKNTLK